MEKKCGVEVSLTCIQSRVYGYCHDKCCENIHGRGEAGVSVEEDLDVTESQSPHQ